MSKITIVEVGMRDGLQNEKGNLSVDQKFELAQRLASTGLKRIEAGAFVSPEKIPQMQNSKELLKKILGAQKANQFSKAITFSALVPNMHGYRDSQEAGVKDIAVFGAVSDTFSQRNINCSVEESLAKFREVVAQAKKDKVKVRGYVSTVFGCPYEGKIKTSRALKIIEKFLDLGIYELSVGDTIGVATPKQVRELLKPLKSDKVISKIAMHFHDTRATALANIAESLEFGVKVFDSSVSGLGGCPYAPGAAGNVATEDVVYLLEGMGLKTGLDLDQLMGTAKWVNQLLNRTQASRLSQAGHSCIY